jgi:hypothetical protein
MIFSQAMFAFDILAMINIVETSIEFTSVNFYQATPS